MSNSEQEVRFSSIRQEFVHIQNIHQLNESELFDANAIILDNKIPSELGKMVSQIRRMRYKSFYLKPIYLNPGEYEPQLLAKVDGVIDFNDLKNVMAEVKKINNRIKDIRSVTSKYTFTESIMVKTLQYMLTRETELVPIRDRQNKLSYCFPYVSSLVPQDDQIALMDVLEKANEEGLIEKELIDRINLCKKCSGSYHNFREACPKCNSLDLDPIDLIHHFRCAYIGPATDFKHGHDLICPKCDKELRHIGIDYDKPSQIFECNSCHHQTQHAEMRAHCIDCGTENELLYLKTRVVNKYRITAYGREIAEHGLQKMDAEKIPNIEDKRIVPQETWEVVLRQEIERQQFKKSTGHIVKVVINKEILEPMDQDTRRTLKKELLHELTGYLRPFDLVSAKTPTNILVLMPDIKVKEVAKYIDVFEYNMLKIIRDNVGEADELISISVIEINGELDINEL